MEPLKLPQLGIASLKQPAAASRETVKGGAAFLINHRAVHIPLTVYLRR